MPFGPASFEYKHTSHNILFRYAKGKSLQSGREIHPYHEILYFVDGGGRFLSEKFEQPLSEHTLFFIPQNTYHNFVIGDQSRYTRLVLNFTDTELFTDFGMFRDPGILILTGLSQEMRHLLDTLCIMMADTDHSAPADLKMYSTFLLLTTQMEMNMQKRITPVSRERDALISRSLQYIDRHFHTGIQVSRMADPLNVSESSLHKCFKNHLGISVYRYITEKRMIHANLLIQEGNAPTKIYMECGYGDYPTFYKAYVKTFGHPPSG